MLTLNYIYALKSMCKTKEERQETLAICILFDLGLAFAVYCIIANPQM